MDDGGPEGKRREGNGKLCGAKTRSGTPCRNWPALGRKRCRLHGGATPAGPASPHWKHGGYSAYVPGHLVEDFKKAVEDPELLSLRADISLTAARQMEVLRAMNEGGASGLWGRLQVLVGACHAALGKRDYPLALDKLWPQIFDLVKQGASYEKAWDDLVRLQDHGRKLRDTERRRLEALQSHVTAEQQIALIAFIIEKLKQYLEPEQMRAFAHELRVVMGGGSSERPVVSGVLPKVGGT